MLKLFKKSNKQQSVSSEKSEVSLILLVEKKLPYMIDYFKSNGVKVADIYTSIEDAKMGLLMQSGLCRVVVIESGLSKFNTTVMRVEFTDLLGMCNGVDKRATVFYTDTLLYSDNYKNTKGQKIDWMVYENTIGVIDRLKSYNEVYIGDGYGSDDTPMGMKEILGFRGEDIELIDGLVKPSNDDIDLTNKAIELLIKNSSDDSSLTMYNVVY